MRLVGGTSYSPPKQNQILVKPKAPGASAENRFQAAKGDKVAISQKPHFGVNHDQLWNATFADSQVGLNKVRDLVEQAKSGKGFMHHLQRIPNLVDREKFMLASLLHASPQEVVGMTNQMQADGKQAAWRIGTLFLPTARQQLGDRHIAEARRDAMSDDKLQYLLAAVKGATVPQHLPNELKNAIQERQRVVDNQPTSINLPSLDGPAQNTLVRQFQAVVRDVLDADSGVDHSPAFRDALQQLAASLNHMPGQRAMAVKAIADIAELQDAGITGETKLQVAKSLLQRAPQLRSANTQLMLVRVAGNMLLGLDLQLEHQGVQTMIPQIRHMRPEAQAEAMGIVSRYAKEIDEQLQNIPDHGPSLQRLQALQKSLVEHVFARQPPNLPEGKPTESTKRTAFRLLMQHLDLSGRHLNGQQRTAWFNNSLPAWRQLILHIDRLSPAQGMVVMRTYLREVEYQRSHLTQAQGPQTAGQPPTGPQDAELVPALRHVLKHAENDVQLLAEGSLSLMRLLLAQPAVTPMPADQVAAWDSLKTAVHHLSERAHSNLANDVRHVALRITSALARPFSQGLADRIAGNISPEVRQAVRNGPHVKALLNLIAPNRDRIPGNVLQALIKSAGKMSTHSAP